MTICTMCETSEPPVLDVEVNGDSVETRGACGEEECLERYNEDYGQER